MTSVTSHCSFTDFSITPPFFKESPVHVRQPSISLESTCSFRVPRACVSPILKPRSSRLGGLQQTRTYYSILFAIIGQDLYASIRQRMGSKVHRLHDWGTSKTDSIHIRANRQSFGRRHKMETGRGINPCFIPRTNA